MKTISSIYIFLILVFTFSFLFGCTPNKPSKEEDSFEEMLFSEGLLAVKKNQKWGYVNQANEVVIDFLYDAAGAFYRVVAHVMTNGVQQEHFLIDSEGNEVLSKRYQRLKRDEETDLLWFYENSKLGLMDHNEKVFKEPFSSSKANYSQYANSFFPSFNCGLAFVPGVDGNSFRLLKQDGTWLNNKQYTQMQSFSNGYAWVIEEGKEEYYVINQKGRVVFKSKFSGVQPFNSNGLAVVCVLVDDVNHYSLIDARGKKIHGDVEAYYYSSSIHPFGNVFFVVQFDKINNTVNYYLLDHNGRKIEGSEGSSIRQVFNSYIRVDKQIQYLVVNRYVYDIDGNNVLDHLPNTEESEYFYAVNEKNELIPYLLNKVLNTLEWNNDNNIVSIEDGYRVSQVFQDRLIVSRSQVGNDLYTIEGINLTNGLVRSMKFYSDGYLVVTNNEVLCGVLDKDGNPIIPIVYDAIRISKNPQFYH